MNTVIVTGASSGIGLATAKALSKRGCQVFAGVRKNADFERLTKEGIEPVLLDVTQEKSMQAAMEAVNSRRKKGNTLSLINNAGLAIGGPVEAVSIEKWKEQFEVNVFGLIRTTQTFLPWIRESKGRVVNISSVSGLAAIPYLGPYAASKFAVEAISDSLRREIQRFGCKVIVIEPGPIQTPIWEKGLGKKEAITEEIPAHLMAVYGESLESFYRMVKKSAESAVSTEKVTQVIEKALFQKNPKTRYVVGDLSVFIQTKLLPFLPDHWMDKMISSQI